MKMEQSIPERWHLNYRRREITQKKAYDKMCIIEQLGPKYTQVKVTGRRSINKKMQQLHIA
jgi:hypothetical protein